MRNTNDGISIIQTAEGAANEVTDILQRMRGSAVQSASETLDDDERSYISDEFTEPAMRSHVSPTSPSSTACPCPTTPAPKLDVQVGIQNATTSRITIDLGDLRATSLAVDTGNVSLANVTSAQEALDNIDTAIDSVNGYRSDFGSVQNRLDSALNNSQVYMEALSSAKSSVMDADFASETSNLTKLQIMQQAGVASLSQAKNINQSVISLLS